MSLRRTRWMMSVLLLPVLLVAACRPTEEPARIIELDNQSVQPTVPVIYITPTPAPTVVPTIALITPSATLPPPTLTLTPSATPDLAQAQLQCQAQLENM